MPNELNELEIKEIKKYAVGKLGECRKGNDIIGNQIFSILSLYARVIYYPLGKDAPWGFTRISGSRNDAALEKPFVAINTSIPLDFQVFAAAHELYHIWYEQNPDVIPEIFAAAAQAKSFLTFVAEWTKAAAAFQHMEEQKPDASASQWPSLALAWLGKVLSEK